MSDGHTGRRGGPEQKKTGRRPRWGWLRTAVAAVVLAGLSAAWYVLPVAEWIDLGALLRRAWSLRESAAAPLFVVATYVVVGLVAPVVVLIGLTGLAFGPLLGFAYAVLGTLASAAALYGLGRLFGGDTLQRLAGCRADRVAQRLAQHGVLTVAAIRLVPVAPFTVVNLVAGTSRIRFRDYALGTLLGMAPGTFVLVVLGDRLGAVAREPGLASGLALGGVLLVAVGAALWRRRARRSRRQ